MHFNLLLTYILDNKAEFLASKDTGDMSDLIHSISTKTSLSNNLTEEFIGYIRDEFEPGIDSLDITFFDMSLSDRKEILEKIFSWSGTARLIIKFLSTATYREVQSLLSDVYTSFRGSNSIVRVTTPKILDAKTKKIVRSHYQQGIVFCVDASLVGGMMVYANGKIIDKSFASLLSRVTNLTT